MPAAKIVAQHLKFLDRVRCGTGNARVCPKRCLFRNKGNTKEVFPTQTQYRTTVPPLTLPHLCVSICSYRCVDALQNQCPRTWKHNLRFFFIVAGSFPEIFLQCPPRNQTYKPTHMHRHSARNWRMWAPKYLHIDIFIYIFFSPSGPCYFKIFPYFAPVTYCHSRRCSSYMIWSEKKWYYWIFNIFFFVLSRFYSPYFILYC